MLKLLFHNESVLLNIVFQYGNFRAGIVRPIFVSRDTRRSFQRAGLLLLSDCFSLMAKFFIYVSFGSKNPDATDPTSALIPSAVEVTPTAEFGLGP